MAQKVGVKKKDIDAKKPDDLGKEMLLLTERKRWGFFGLPFTFTVYTLTSKRMLIKTGLLHTREEEILLYRVKDVSLSRTLSQKMFGLGNLHIQSSDQTLPKADVVNIKNSREFKEMLSMGIERERLRLRYRATEFIDGGEDGGDDFYD